MYHKNLLIVTNNRRDFRDWLTGSLEHWLFLKLLFVFTTSGSKAVVQDGFSLPCLKVCLITCSEESLDLPLRGQRDHESQTCHIWECEAEGPRQSTYVAFLNSSALFLSLSVFLTHTVSVSSFLFSHPHSLPRIGDWIQGWCKLETVLTLSNRVDNYFLFWDRISLSFSR